MLCPACGKSLIVLEHENVELDYCHGCHGIWLDAGELDLLLGGVEARSRFLTVDAAGKSGEALRKCPVCARKMGKMLTAGEHPVIYDRCDRDGVWFDQGELEAVLEQGSIVEGNHDVVDFLRGIFTKPRAT
jgi:hypothetical protein